MAVFIEQGPAAGYYRSMTILRVLPVLAALVLAACRSSMPTAADMQHFYDEAEKQAQRDIEKAEALAAAEKAEAAATLAATGGPGSYTWERTDGALPVGLELDPSTGRISGTPATWTPSSRSTS